MTEALLQSKLRMPALRSSLVRRPRLVERLEAGRECWLDASWADWLEGFSLSYPGNETVLSGQVTDQAALYGLIAKLRDLGVKLLSVKFGEQVSGDVP